MMGVDMFFNPPKDESEIKKKKMEQKAIYDFLIKKAIKSADKAYAPYSAFRVGAAILTHKNKIFCGANVENASYGATICAERVAIMKAVFKGHVSFKAIAICCLDSSNPLHKRCPCGQCLQVMSEFFNGSELIILCDELGGNFCRDYSKFHPYRFELERP
jgi:cytidine deaminase